MIRRPLLMMVAILLILGVSVQRCTASIATGPVARGETVILLHGLMTTTWHMARIEGLLRREGYRIVNWGYDSRHGTVESHARALHAAVQALPSDGPVHFVGFSLGALIARYYLSHYDVPRAGRFVMIGPPNHGSELADALYPSAWFRAVIGSDPATQLRASDSHFFSMLGEPAVITGVIAGGRGDDRGFSAALPGDDDGRVSVASAGLDSAVDFVVLPHRHVVLLVADDTRQQILNFLTTGRFDHRTSAFRASRTHREEGPP